MVFKRREAIDRIWPEVEKRSALLQKSVGHRWPTIRCRHDHHRQLSACRVGQINYQSDHEYKLDLQNKSFFAIDTHCTLSDGKHNSKYKLDSSTQSK